MRKKLLLVLLCALFFTTAFAACSSSYTEFAGEEDQVDREEKEKDKEQGKSNEETKKEEEDTGNGIFEKPLEWGRYVTFGAYEQDNIKENGKEEIEWLVLEIGDEEALLISRYCLDAMPLHEEWEGVTWEECSLRKWLNEVFYQEAFSAKERKCIVETELNNPENNGFFSAAPETTDAVFLLSMEEAYEYFEDGDVWETEFLRVNKGRATEPTKYADVKGQFTGEGTEWYDNMADWWLRSADGSDGFACRVYCYGSIDDWGEHSYVNSVAGVRPAIRVRIAEPKEEKIEEKVIKGDIKTGKIVTIGTFEQDNIAENNREDIQWIVLDVQQDKALLLSRYALDCQMYHRKEEAVTWEGCFLRQWLNSVFYDMAFNEREKAVIAETELENPDSQKYGTYGGNSTWDRVFVLSVEEARQYFPADESYENRERAAIPTDYALACGVNADTYLGNEWFDENCKWWLRTPGFNCETVAQVGMTGIIDEGGALVTDVDAMGEGGSAVRPAMWVTLGE